jgi:hypothetical protein
MVYKYPNLPKIIAPLRNEVAWHYGLKKKNNTLPLEELNPRCGWIFRIKVEVMGRRIGRYLQYASKSKVGILTL